jgi:RHS repeat-associated protein
VAAPRLPTRYVYDAIGNRSSKTDPNGTTTAYSYDANARLLSAGAASCGYDANGNLLSETNPGGTTSYTYDGLNRLTRLAAPSGQTTFSYDAQGNRVRKADATGTTNYLVDPFGWGADGGLAQVLRETDGSGAGQADYVYGSRGDLISQQRAGGVGFYLPDAGGSERILTESTGAVTDRYDYDAFGNPVSQTGTTANPYRYGGQQLDAVTGLYCLRARYYSPSTGRFLTRDPFAGLIFDPPSLHPYTYAHNDPVNKTDPSGKFTMGEVLAVSVIVGILAGLALETFAAFKTNSTADILLAFVAGFVAGFVVTAMLLGGTLGALGLLGEAGAGGGAAAATATVEVAGGEVAAAPGAAASVDAVTAQLERELIERSVLQNARWFRQFFSMMAQVRILRGAQGVLQMMFRFQNAARAGTLGVEYAGAIPGARIFGCMVVKALELGLAAQAGAIGPALGETLSFLGIAAC